MCMSQMKYTSERKLCLQKEKIVKPEGYSDIEPFLSGFPTVQNFPLRKKYKILVRLNNMQCTLLPK